MKYYVEAWETDEVIEEFDSDEERTQWIKENCYPSQDMSRFYWIKGDVRISIADY